MNDRPLGAKHVSQRTDPSSPPITPDAALFKVLNATRSALEALDESCHQTQVDAWVDHILGSKGRVVLCGMGKSGLVAQKIAATLASTGRPSFFLHPAEALHGDLGMVTPEDTMMILSNSGESQEILNLLPSLLRLGIRIAAITSRPDSRLGQSASWCFTYRLPEGEGCPLDFAPMASTTIQMVWGDMLAANLMVRSGFTLEKFAQFHPAGNIGSKLLNTKDIMNIEFPTVEESTPFFDVLSVMTQGRLGMTTVLKEGRLVGVISDGDIRRAVGQSQARKGNPLDLLATDFMTKKPVTISRDLLAIEAAGIMESRKITFLVVEADGYPQGVLHIHDLLAAKVI
jgi:arabinose-5-phosphate isomerase